MSVHFRAAQPADIEALLPMAAHTLHGVVRPENAAARGLYERHGFAATDRLLLSRPVSRPRVLCTSRRDAQAGSVVQ